MKDYSIRFGSGDPRTYTGLSPTFLFFTRLSDGATLTPPAINEPLTGGGVYHFQYGTTQAIAFLADAATTSPGTTGRYVSGQIDPSDRADEYGTSIIAFGATLNAIGTTSIAYSTSLVAIGVTSLAYSTSLVATGVTITQGLTNQGTTLVAIGNTGIAIGLTTLALSGSGSSFIGTIGSTFGGSTTDPVDLFGFLKRIQENLEGNQTYLKTSGAFSFYSRGSSTLLATKTVVNSVSLVTKT